MKCSRQYRNGRTLTREVHEAFDPESDYVSMVNTHLQITRRPHSEQRVAQYVTIRATTPFVIEVRLDHLVWKGLPQSKIKLAKQSAAYESWKTLSEPSSF